MSSDFEAPRPRAVPSGPSRLPPARNHRDPRASARRRRLATATWGVALHGALAALFAGPLAVEAGLAYLVPAALAVLAPRT
ncbi:glycosyl transferase, partial [Frankia sp. AiPs1]|nr:glycosyl transferase [Frankia sp. AiPs1]